MDNTGTKHKHTDNLNKTLMALPEAERIGKDEMNLVEHPFALLKTHGKDRNIIEIEFERRHPKTGKTVKASWRVAGDPTLGLPGPTEERLYLVLMELTREQGMPQTVWFSRADLLHRMGLTSGKNCYKILEEAFLRLKSVTVHAKNAFYNHAGKDLFAFIGFSLIDNYAVSHEKSGPRTQGALPLSWAKWNDEVYNSMKAGNVRTIDTVFALSLDLPLALRLYRYLDKHRFAATGPRKSYQVGLKRLCEVHLGMAPAAYPSKHKERLQPAHSELLDRGFLSGIEYTPMRSKDGEKVIYSFGDGISAVVEPVPAMSMEQACDTIIERLKVESPQEYERVLADAIDVLSDIERAIWERTGKDGLMAAPVRENMHIIIGQEYRNDVQELTGKI